MSKSINFGLFLTFLCISFVSSTDVDPFGIEEQVVAYIRNKVVEKINIYRIRHAMGTLELMEQMIDMAQEQANRLAQYSQFGHTPNGMYGENIAKTPRIVNVGETVVDLWYGAIAGVKLADDHSQFYTNQKLGPMLQLLWGSSNEIGIGVAQSEDDHFYVVAHFNPAMGNAENDYEFNVPQFTQEEINEGIYQLNTFHFTNYPISISNSRTGCVELSDLQNKSVDVLPKYFDQYNTEPYVHPFGFSDAEAVKIRKKILEKTNFYRYINEIGDLSIDPKINNIAQDFANALAAVQKLEDSQHWENHEYGENKFKCSPIIFGNFGEVAVDLWYYELESVPGSLLYTNNEQNTNDEIDNLTQLLWMPTKKMGVGVSIDIEGNYYVVVNYNPAGNLKDYFIQNLPKFEDEDIAYASDKADELFGVLAKANVKNEVV